MKWFSWFRKIFFPSQKKRKSIHIFEFIDHLEEFPNVPFSVTSYCEILPIDSLRDETMNFIEIDEGLIIPLNSRPEMKNSKTSKVVQLYESDSEDEEILFSREMLKRLQKKEEKLKNSRADDLISLDTNSEKSQESSSKNPSSLSPPLSERTKKKIIEEIQNINEVTGELMKRKTKEIFFGKRMTEFNNSIRILERKKEESIWNEKYSEAATIDNCLKDLRAREAGMKELLIEREDFLKNNDLMGAQRSKDRFDKNMNDALHNSDLHRILFKEDE